MAYAMEHHSVLKAKHADIDSAIQQEMKRPLPDFTRITKLKKQKLRIKEEIRQFGEPAVA